MYRVRWKSYRTPFPHLVGVANGKLDELMEKVAGEFPPLDAPDLIRFDNQQERKTAYEKWRGHNTVELVEFLSGGDFVDEVAAKLEIGGNITTSFYGGGYHMIPVGGFLNMHVDFNQLSDGVYRRANVLCYLNDLWQEGEGGELILGQNRDKAILPQLGTVVAFPTGESSWHGHPNPVTRVRRSFAMYIYSDQPSPDYTGYEHTTIFA